MKYFVALPGGNEVAVDVDLLPTGQTMVTVGDRTFEADVVQVGAALSVRIDGRMVDLWTEGVPPDVGAVACGNRFYARVESERLRALSVALGSKGGAEGSVRSPMPGRVLKVLVQEGEPVKSGAPLVVVEAMKMENELVAGKDGTVKKVYVAPGDTVEGGALLCDVE